MFNKVVSYVKGIFADQDHSPSFVRHACGALITVWCYLAIKKMGIPDHTPEFAYLVGVLYGSNAVRNAVQSFTGGRKEGPEPGDNP